MSSARTPVIMSLYVVFWLVLFLFSKNVRSEDGVLDINVPNVIIKAQSSGDIHLQSNPYAKDLFLKSGPQGTLRFDGQDLLEVIKMAQTLPPLWLPHAHFGFFGTFEGGQTIHIKLEARNPDDSDLEYRLIAGNLPHGITLDENGGYLNGEVPDIERLYSFTIRAINNQTKYADSVFKMEVIGKDNCKSNPCQNKGACVDQRNNTFSCICADQYSGQKCDIDCKNNAFGVADKRKIPDAQMSAYLSQSTYLASNGRYGGGSYWCGANNNAWLQIDLGDVRKVYKTRYQYYNSNYYVDGYTISTSVDGVNFQFLNDTNGIHTFHGGRSTYTDELPAPKVARFIRYHPQGYRSGYYPCMRVELYGC